MQALVQGPSVEAEILPGRPFSHIDLHTVLVCIVFRRARQDRNPFPSGIGRTGKQGRRVTVDILHTQVLYLAIRPQTPTGRQFPVKDASVKPFEREHLAVSIGVRIGDRRQDFFDRFILGKVTETPPDQGHHLVSGQKRPLF